MSTKAVRIVLLVLLLSLFGFTSYARTNIPALMLLLDGRNNRTTPLSENPNYDEVQFDLIVLE